MNKDYRIICNLNNGENGETMVPKMPLILAIDKKVGEAKSIRGLMCLLIEEYIDAEDNIDDWNLRVRFARIECMRLLAKNINAIVYDEDKGVINNNYAADQDDPDYKYDEADENTAIKIYVDNEKIFLMSLAKLGSIKILERDDSYQFRTTSDKKVSCSECSHRNDDVCDVYKKKIDKNIECESGTKSSIKEYMGGKYMEVQ